jgi:hypothetical protein
LQDDVLVVEMTSLPVDLPDVVLSQQLHHPGLWQVVVGLAIEVIIVPPWASF